ncbi:MAG: HEAT repeat domain-containing protein, partial [Candidatus Thorarchaeota archaeon]
KKRIIHQNSEAGELSVLRRVISARSNIYADNFRQQLTALNAIVLAKTQLCNDILMALVSDDSHQIRRRVLRHLGESGDSAVMEFLAGVMKNDDDESIRNEAARAYSMLISSSQFSNIDHTMPPPSKKTPPLIISEINRILNDLITKGMPSTMIDDTLAAIAIQGGSDAIDILTSLLAKPQVIVRMSVVKASQSLENTDAALIIRAALDDDSLHVVALAEKELDTRWPDAVWD